VEKGRRVTSLVVMLALVVGLLVWMIGFGARPNLGLDLRGGISVVLTPEVEEGHELDDEILDETVEIIRSRVDALGVAEPEIARQGDDILVQLPGIEDRERALEVIGQTAALTFRPVLEVMAPGTPEYEEEGPDCATQLRPEDPIEDDAEAVLCGSADDAAAGMELSEDDAAAIEPMKYRVGPAALGGEAIDDAIGVPEQTAAGGVTNTWVTQLQLTGPGGQQFANITGELACQRDQGHPGGGRLAIVLDEVVESAPTMSPDVACGTGITGGTAVITVGGEQQAAQDLALVLRTGALPITLVASTAYNVSPTLGAQSLDAGITAGLIGLALVALWLLAFYRWLGAAAVAELAVFGVMIVGAITLLGEAGFTLTLAGIAGIIVSIGIAADSSILYRERIQDELDAGKSIRSAVVRAFGPAFRTNLTGNTVTLTAALVLYVLAVGPVRGFAFTLGLSTLLDLFILYFFTRPLVQLMGNTKLLMGRQRARRTPDVPGRREQREEEVATRSGS
jgi:preprotein translocase subunit SecD